MAATVQDFVSDLEERLIIAVQCFLSQNKYYVYRKEQTRSRIAIACAGHLPFPSGTWTKIFEDYILQCVVAYLDVFRGALPYIAFHHSTARIMDDKIKQLARVALASGSNEEFKKVEDMLSRSRLSCGIPAFDEIIELTPDRSAEIIQSIRSMTFDVLRQRPTHRDSLTLLEVKRFLVPGETYNVVTAQQNSVPVAANASLEVAVQEQTKLSSMYMGDVVRISRKIGDDFIRKSKVAPSKDGIRDAVRLYREFEKAMIRVLLSHVFTEMMSEIVQELTRTPTSAPSAGQYDDYLGIKVNNIVASVMNNGKIHQRRDYYKLENMYR